MKLLLLISLLASARAQQLGLIVNPDASYAVTLDGKTVPHLTSAVGAYVVRYDGVVHSSANGSLALDAAPTTISGSDVLGAFSGFAATFNAGVFAVSFKLYAARDAIVFAQTFPKGAKGMAGGDKGGLSSAFPVFGQARESLADKDTGFVTWSGGMCTGRTGVWTESSLGSANFGDQSGPIVIYNASRAVAVSPASGFMTANLNFVQLTDMALGSGLGGMVDEVPVGWTYETIVVSGAGVTATMLSLGDALLLRGGKTRTAANADVAVSTLGYWTDNGAYYYYNSENNSESGNMQKTIVDVLAYGESIGLPYRHVMYDSWWYKKECPGSTDSWLVCKGGLILWEPREDVFPDGFNFEVPGNLPLVLHNRWFSANNNTYITDLGFADSFIVESAHDFALPIKADVFEYLMGRAQKWGMTVYEQDWLITVWETMDVTKSNVTAGETWLAAMAQAASSLGITIQYCMPLPRHMLESTKHQAVTNARASGDYHPGASNWDIGISSLFYWAIGVAPSKDDYWTTEVQPGNPYGDKPTEPNWMLEAITVALSTGPNGPSDGIGFTNASVVLATVRADGLTLQPDRPATIADAAFVQAIADGALPNVRTTSTTYSNYTWYYALSVGLEKDFTMPVPGPVGDATQYAVFTWFDYVPRAVIASQDTVTIPHGQGNPWAPATAKNIDFTLLVPELPGGWWLVGEKNKYVGMSKQRVTSLEPLADGFTADVLTPVASETVTFLILTSPNTPTDVACAYNAAGTATLKCTAGACSCS